MKSGFNVTVHKMSIVLQIDGRSVFMSTANTEYKDDGVGNIGITTSYTGGCRAISQILSVIDMNI